MGAQDALWFAHAAARKDTAMKAGTAFLAVAALLIQGPTSSAQMPRPCLSAGCFAGPQFQPVGLSISFGGGAPLRLFPTFGGGFYGGIGPIGPVVPIVPIVSPYGVGPFASPIYPTSFVAPPIVISPPSAPGDMGSTGMFPPARGGALAGEPAGRFRPVAQQDRARARLAQPAAAKAAEPVNPVLEYDRCIREARTAFTEGSYGRSADLCRKAIEITTERAPGHLLLGHAAFALGKFADATAAIHRGVRRGADWPATGPLLRELYGGRIADFDQHRRLLDEVADAFPSDATYQFLRAYIAWFDDRRAESRRMFESLRLRVADPAVIDRFLAQP
jgi:hypothetical protein